MRWGSASVVAVALLVASCGGSSAGGDGGPDLAMPGCTSDHDCDDGVFCNGPSVCAPGVGCLPGAPPCATGQVCSETARTCTTNCAVTADADADGHMAMLCGGDDCNDADANAYPGNTEVCDIAMHDEDCDAASYGFRDMDGDGYGDEACCNGTDHCGTDCDDGVATVHPTQAETCNGRDDDCNGMVDDGITMTWTVDADHDGHGDATPGAATMTGCAIPSGFAPSADDCADGDAARHPGLPEICNEADDDCNGMIDDVAMGTCNCAFGTMQDCGLPGRCAGATQTCTPGGTWGTCSIVPIGETCNDMDDDCNGTVDDGLRVGCWGDADDDGYSTSATPMTMECASADPARMAYPRSRCPVGFTARAPTTASALDCCEGDPNAHPGATTFEPFARLCGGFDFDCDGTETLNLPGPIQTCSGNMMTACMDGTHGGWEGPTVPGCGGSMNYDFCVWVTSPPGPGCYAFPASGVPMLQACR